MVEASRGRFVISLLLSAVVSPRSSPRSSRQAWVYLSCFPHHSSRKPHLVDFVNSYLPLPSCGTNAALGESRKALSRGRVSRAEGEENAMEVERDGAAADPESGNGEALRHSDTRARVKWKRVARRVCARGLIRCQETRFHFVSTIVHAKFLQVKKKKKKSQ